MDAVTTNLSHGISSEVIPSTALNPFNVLCIEYPIQVEYYKFCYLAAHTVCMNTLFQLRHKY